MAIKAFMVVILTLLIYNVNAIEVWIVQSDPITFFCVLGLISLVILALLALYSFADARRSSDRRVEYARRQKTDQDA